MGIEISHSVNGDPAKNLSYSVISTHDAWIPSKFFWHIKKHHDFITRRISQILLGPIYGVKFSICSTHKGFYKNYSVNRSQGIYDFYA